VAELVAELVDQLIMMSTTTMVPRIIQLYRGQPVVVLGQKVVISLDIPAALFNAALE
jgi:hypothetical protein